MTPSLESPAGAISAGDPLANRGNVSARWIEIAFPKTLPTPSEPTLADGARIVQAAISILEQGELLLSAVSPQSYTERLPIAFNASIGGHYRHCLDHFTSLFRGDDQPEIDYDRRDRDRRVETEPDFALHLTRSMRKELQDLTSEDLRLPVRVRCAVSYEKGPSPVTSSTRGRELSYAIAHAIHHYALISIIARLLEVALPITFGVAPSTLAHQAKIGSSSTSR